MGVTNEKLIGLLEKELGKISDEYFPLHSTQLAAVERCTTLLAQDRGSITNNTAKKKSASAPSGSTIELSTTRTTSTTSSGFDVQTQKNGVLDQVQSKPPKTSRISSNDSPGHVKPLRRQS